MDIDINKSCCFTGHRPEKCKGTEADIRVQLKERIQVAIDEGYTTFITGMAAGVDTWAAQEVLEVKATNSNIKLICAVPFPGVEKNRTLEEQELFKLIFSKADETVFICKKHQRWCFHARDEWMVNHSSKVIAVFNGSPGGTEETINYAKAQGRIIDFIDNN